MWSIESLLPVPAGSSGSTRIDSRPGVSPGDLRSIERRGQKTLAERVPNKLRPRFSDHGYSTQRAANTSSPRSDVLRRWSQATGPCEGTTARRCLCLRTGSGITEARPHPRALPPPRTTWAKWTSRVYFVPQSKWPLPRSLRASEPVDPRERGGNDGAVSEQSQLCGCLSLSDYNL